MNYDLVWGGLALAVLGAFGALQVKGIGEGHQFSRHLRKWLGVAPPHWRAWILGPAFGLFLSWLGIHILTPWL